jgi:hypothetical protein
MPPHADPIEPSDSDTMRQVLENFGATMYVAQILESDLQIIVTCLETIGLVQIDREEYKVTEDKHGVIEACIGPMLYWMREHSTIKFPSDLIDSLRKANMQRNLLAHRFLLMHSGDLMTQAGRRTVNSKLLRIHSHLHRVMKGLQRIRNKLFAQYGLTEEVMQQRLEALKRDILDRENI